MTAFEYDLDPIVDKAPKMGLIVLQADETIEGDFRRLISDEMPLYVSRVESGLEVSKDSLGKMQEALPRAVRLLPQGLSFDVVGYGCTSGSAVIGPENIKRLITENINAKAVTEPLSALIAVCKKLGISRLAFLSPYVDSVSQKLRDELKTNGIDTAIFGTFNEAEEEKVVRISPQSVYEAGVSLGQNDMCQALFISCTNLRTLSSIRAIEDELNKPVLTSNQVLAWHMKLLAGDNTPIENAGKFLQTNHC